MVLSLDAIAQNPQDYQFPINSHNGEYFILRPLEKKDEAKLAELIESLSVETKRFIAVNKSSESIAKEQCDAINKYDKLRFVLEKVDKRELVGLFEFSFGIPQGDFDRFEKYGIKLSERTDCRMGPLLRDAYQSQGIASVVLPILISIAKQFCKKRIILWGGVMQENTQAVRFYEKNDFKNVGAFIDHPQGMDPSPCYDMILYL